ncbi:MAG: serine hydrolase, partial [Pseudomonadales bacterium]|nr:serine hydrolase [Pseudomonadales bacterium]
VLRDLLSHTSGIENTPISYRSAFTGVHTPELLWNLLSESSSNEDAPYGSFQYTNTGYNILTVLTDRKLGILWQDLVKQEVIEPLGMTRTTARMSEAETLGWQIAKPHGLVTGEQLMERLYLEKVDSTMQSAGGMVMSPNDAKRWLELFVNDGVVDGRQIVAPEIIEETRDRLASVDRQFGDYLREDYGLGWYISSYKEDLMIHHFGSFSGFRAHVSYLPERNVGVAVFVNDSLIGSYLADSIANSIYDLATGRLAEPESVSAAKDALVERHDRLLTAVDEGRRSRAGRTWQLSQPRSAYVGTYVSPRLGSITVSLQDNELFVEMGVMHAIGTPYMEPDSVRVELAPLSGTVLRFDVDDQGEVTAIDYVGERLDRI